MVADKPFLNYHNNTDPDTYILTIMNMVADLFHDASVGNLIVCVCVLSTCTNKKNSWTCISIKILKRRSAVSANGS